MPPATTAGSPLSHEEWIEREEEVGNGWTGLPSADLTSMDAYRQLPFTTGDELAADQSRTPPYGTQPTFPLEHYVQEHHTSGTTGQGLCWLDDAESWAWFGRCWARVFRAAGVTAADRVFFPFSFGPFSGHGVGWRAHGR